MKISIHSRGPRNCRGMTLVELMVSITIGMIIVGAMSLIFANNSRTRSETERSSQKVENGRFAIDLLSGELQHAGYFAEFDPSKLTPPAAVPDPCLTTLADLQTALALQIQGVNNAATVPSCLSDVKAGTDIVVVRRASTCTGSSGCTAVAAGAPIFQASSCNDSTELGSTDVSKYFKLDTVSTAFTLRKRDCTTLAGTRRYVLRLYFVANNDKPGDGIPTLKRADLTASGGSPAFVTTSLVQGVDNLQVEYGMDADGSGDPDIYTQDPGTYGGCTAASTPTCSQRWTSVVSAKLYVLARNVDKTPGWQDTKSYNLGGTTVAASNDAYKRAVFQEVVRLVNVSGRRF
jgi:type IV pilus assembly protein PilW